MKKNHLKGTVKFEEFMRNLASFSFKDKHGSTNNLIITNMIELLVKAHTWLGLRVNPFPNDKF